MAGSTTVIKLWLVQVCSLCLYLLLVVDNHVATLCCEMIIIICILPSLLCSKRTK